MASVEQLQRLMLFEALSQEQLAWLSENSTEIRAANGEKVFSEGQPAHALLVLIEGEWQLTRFIGDSEVTLVTTSQPGTWSGGIPLVSGIYQSSAHALKPSHFLVIPDEAC